MTYCRKSLLKYLVKSVNHQFAYQRVHRNRSMAHKPEAINARVFSKTMMRVTSSIPGRPATRYKNGHSQKKLSAQWKSSQNTKVRSMVGRSWVSVCAVHVTRLINN